MTITLEQFKLYRDNAGWSTPPGRAACAIELARAAQLLERAIDAGVASVEWVNDDHFDFQGWQDVVTNEKAARMFESGEWSYPLGVMLAIEDEPNAASLLGIVVGPKGTDDPYCRVIEAELASEVESELRLALARHALQEAAEGIEA